MFNYLLQLFTRPIFNDAPEPFQIGFQDGASPGFEGIVALHDSIFFYLVLISIGVFWMLFSVKIIRICIKTYKYTSHNLDLNQKSKYKNTLINVLDVIIIILLLSYIFNGLFTILFNIILTLFDWSFIH